ncbi:FtsQ-type POTRA domain-containing protein [Candidatus Peribacteria bacterium]|jgi:hypothetical protein|nr:FtsQ-type POTRA domain-containing protein [Candidatus Peribacteria bacterium]MBT4021721.1 FtsQ-type POTRA domain-containing protein [Candidatus Peribacteria bacterium]MBT4241184.1 FtsQ-type POTRA domain-containing protein [Candidatus Peribacteria bacterium]MBT4473937.1 FtsQ-type POTRA domain-containing protein [Candidatus Peribacteria bacterium]
MLKPSRRLPRKLQRPTSELSRRTAQKLLRKKKKGVSKNAAKYSRHFRRIFSGIKESFSQLKIWCAVSVGVFVLIIISYFLFSDTFKVSSMHVARQDRRVDVEEIQKLLKPFFGKHILFVSPLLIEHTIQSEYPEVSRADVGRNFPNELWVKLYMDDISAEVSVGDPDGTENEATENAWKPDSSLEEESGSRYKYLSKEGVYLEYPFAIASNEDEEMLKLYLVDWAVKPEKRQRLIKKDVLSDIKNAKRILEETFGHSVSFITFYLSAQEFHIKTEGVILWFDLATPVAAHIDRYRQFLKAVPLEEVEEYIDLRPHDRVIHR